MFRGPGSTSAKEGLPKQFPVLHIPTSSRPFSSSFFVLCFFFYWMIVNLNCHCYGVVTNINLVLKKEKKWKSNCKINIQSVTYFNVFSLDLIKMLREISGCLQYSFSLGDKYRKECGIRTQSCTCRICWTSLAYMGSINPSICLYKTHKLTKHSWVST